MAVFRVEKNSGYTVMSNHHLRNRALSLKAKGLLSQMLSLPEDWDYTLQGLAHINRESIDAIRQAIRELEQAGYIQRSRERDEKGRLRGADYVIFELPQPVVRQRPLQSLPHHDGKIPQLQLQQHLADRHAGRTAGGGLQQVERHVPPHREKGRKRHQDSCSCALQGQAEDGKAGRTGQADSG